jgi:hypothetical protein
MLHVREQDVDLDLVTSYWLLVTLTKTMDLPLRLVTWNW